MVGIPPPPPNNSPDPLWHVVKSGEYFLRLYDPTKFGATATSFRTYGPISRFDHHREFPNNIDPARGIMYAAANTLSCCLVEVFGDTKVVSVGDWEVARLKSRRELTLLELRGSGAMRAGSVASVTKDSSRRLSQLWSRYFYEQSFLYKLVDGLVYSNAHNEEIAYALYERAEDAIECVGICKLRSAALRTELLSSAAENGMVVEPYEAA